MRFFIALCGIGVSLEAAGGVVEMGSGSYTTTFPGTDIAGRNAIPGGTPQLSGAVVGRPVPTNDWWSALLKTNHATNLFNYPLAMRTLPAGLDVGLILPSDGVNGSTQPLSDVSPVVVGVKGLAASRATVDDYSDWTVTIGWDSGGRMLRATTGIGMPFIYFRKAPTDTASVTVNVGTVTINGETLLITGSQGGANFAVYAPAGSTWQAAGNTYTSTLAGKDYWSMAILPTGSAVANAEAWKAYAYVEPLNTQVSWSYDESTATLRTEFATTVTVHEGTGTTILQGLLPHQWAWLSPDAPPLMGQSIGTIRGELKLLAANHFATERRFQGILPTLPAPGARSAGFNPEKLHEKIVQLQDETLATWTDSYNEGQVMNRLIQTARAAHETGDTTSRDKILRTVKERLEDWLTAEPGEVAFLFHYQPTWTTLIGYPAGHGQDSNINDHHFHWGYFIHAAAFMEQFEPGWAAEWGGMIDLLIRDAASPDRDDPLFPFLRSFSPFAGHAWANGFATFPFGNDQESSSESMQFNSALIHWGAVTGDKTIRDLGIYLYTTEQTAIEEYWLDINNRTFKPNYGFSLASRIWGNGYDNQTFWTSDIAAAYGIELYPIHGGSFYLGQNIAYAESLWTEMAQKTGVLNQPVNANLWHDVYWQFLAFTDPATAIALYDANPGRSLKFGVSDAQTYYWIHAMNALGQLESSVTADDPLAVVFTRNGQKTYVAHNYTGTVKTVHFSDGASLVVPPSTLATSLDLPFKGTLETPFAMVPAGNSVPLIVALTGDTTSLTAVEIYNGSNWIGTLNEAPYAMQTGALGPGRPTFYARLYDGMDYTFSSLTTVTVGDRLPFGGIPIQIPGSFDAGSYDAFTGGNGQGITYYDSSIGNNGDHRSSEYVDTSVITGEGTVVGWIAAGEWLDYTVEVAESGVYKLEFRYASGNQAGGGPLLIEQDGRAAAAKSVATTGNWSTFQTATLEGLELWAGESMLRIRFIGGELNLGRLTLTRTGALAYEPPYADAGADATVRIPATSALLDGGGSHAAAGKSLTWYWEQLAGPAVARIDNPLASQTEVTGLTEDGLYRFRLTVDDGMHSAFDTVELRRGEATALTPSISILSPSAGATVIAGQSLPITVSATDPDGQIQRVDFFNSDLYIGSVDRPPYVLSWSPPEGNHSLTAIATDSDGLSATSAALLLAANPALPCRRASAGGDFEYAFSDSSQNPTVTFIPSRSGVGANIVILYYGVGGGPYPGYILTPNVPFPINAASGDTINFYFTYSVPEGGERNTLGEKTAYTIGTCGPPIDTNPVTALATWRAKHFTASDLANLALEASVWGNLADPDRDQLPNMIEFTTGSDPFTPSGSPITVITHPLTGELLLRFSRRLGLPGAYGQLEVSADLSTWTAFGGQVRPVSLLGEIELLEMDYDPDALDNLFLRLRTPE